MLNYQTFRRRQRAKAAILYEQVQDPCERALISSPKVLAFRESRKVAFPAELLFPI